jgi:hypothetical protein
MPRQMIAARIAIATALLPAACGSVTPASVSAVKACTDLAQAVCMKRASCTNGTGIIRANGDMTTCVSREELTCTTALAAPDNGNNPNMVEQCVAAYASYTCTDFMDGNPPAACAPSGPRPVGAPCTFNGQCTTGFCGRSKNANCGACAAPTASGDSCAASNCGHNQACTEGTSTCVTYVDVGGVCGQDSPCAALLNCMGANAATTSTGTCMMAASTVGAACGAGTAGCDPGQGLYCGGAAGGKTCMMTAFVGDGAPCGLMTDGTRAACRAGACYTTARLARADEVGACKAYAADGAACDSALGPSCMAPARCEPSGSGTAGTCTVPDATTCT